MQLQSGTYLQGDKYRIIKTLGNGGFGITYLAEHELAGRNVCIKEFFPKEYYNRDDDSRNVSLGSNGSAEIMGRFKEFLALLDGDGEATILPPQQPLTPPSEDTIITPPVKEQPQVEPRKAEQPKPTPTPTTPKKRSKWWLWLLLLLIAVGGFVGYMMSGGDDKPKSTYSVGDYYNENGKEGVVFEVWDDGRHGKIVSLDETKAPWDSRVKWDSANGYSGGTRTYADSESDGKANTDKIMARSDSEYFDAFEWCRAKGSSWYLPATDELKRIYNNKDKLNSTLRQYGTILSFNWYWSSTESVEDKPEFCAWYVSMRHGFTSFSPKSINNYVRAVSVF